MTKTIGTANPNFKDGRFSKFLPAQLDRLYREALSNPDLMELNENMALIEAHMKDILQTSAAGDPVPSWSQVGAAFADVETAMLQGDPAKFIPALEAFHKMLDAGQQWDLTWVKVTDLMEIFRKMADTEIKRKKELNQMVPIERVVILMAALGAAVKRNVKDPNEVAAVYRELAMLHGTDNVPGQPSQQRVGPEIIEVSSRSSMIGVGGGRSKAAIQKRRTRELRKQAEAFQVEQEVRGALDGGNK